jgi:hypothetical protein
MYPDSEFEGIHHSLKENGNVFPMSHRWSRPVAYLFRVILIAFRSITSLPVPGRPCHSSGTRGPKRLSARFRREALSR